MRPIKLVFCAVMGGGLWCGRLSQETRDQGQTAAATSATLAASLRSDQVGRSSEEALYVFRAPL